MAEEVTPPVTCPSCGAVASLSGGFCAQCGQTLETAVDVPAATNPYTVPVAANPYAAPVNASAIPVHTNYPPHVVKQVEAVIRDGNQVLLAVLIGFLCTGLAAGIIGPWFLYRLFCWKRLARDYPSLQDNHASTGGLEYRFQQAKGRLIAGVVIGGVFMLFALSMFVALFTLS